MEISFSNGVLPALAFAVYVLSGALLFWGYALKHYRDDEIAVRPSGATTKNLRLFFSFLMSPWLRLLKRAELPADAITSVSLAISLAAGAALAAGHFALGGELFVLASVCDYFDGRLARSQGGGSKKGAALDSIVDRYSEVALLTGLCWYYRHTWVLLPALLALSGSLLVPYARAKGESLGIVLADVGFLQRPERAMILGASTSFAPLVDAIVHYLGAATPPQDGAGGPALHGLTVAGLLVLAVGTQWSAAQRTLRLLAALAPSKGATPRKGARAMVSSAVATFADASLVALLVGPLTWPLPLSTALGCALGAVVNFTLNRHWAFLARSGSMGQQAKRYVLVSLTSAGLNTAGVAVMALLPHVPDALVWLLVRAAVFGTWTFPLYSSYVFLRDTRQSHPGLEMVAATEPRK